jgi:hypothetical protein
MRTFSSADITDAFQQWKKLPDAKWHPTADVRALLLRIAGETTDEHAVYLVKQALGQEESPQEPVERHVCGMHGFGALGDVCPPCHRAYERAVRRGHEGGRDGA